MPLKGYHESVRIYRQNPCVIHSVDVPWWGDLVKPTLSYEGGFITVPTTPGLGIDELNESLIIKQACADFPEPWSPTTEWDKEWANDRRWS